MDKLMNKTDRQAVSTAYALALMGAQMNSVKELKQVAAAIAHNLEPHMDSNLAEAAYNQFTGQSDEK
jgi:hypothetical protein